VREEASPFGVEFDVNATGGVAVYPSKAALKRLKTNPQLSQVKLLTKAGLKLTLSRKPLHTRRQSITRKIEANT